MLLIILWKTVNKDLEIFVTNGMRKISQGNEKTDSNFTIYTNMYLLLFTYIE